MGTIEIDGKTIEIENMLAEQDHLYRRNAQLSVRLKYPGDVELFIDAVNSNRVELVAKRAEEPRLLLERAEAILREETAERGIYPGSCELSDGSIYVSMHAQNDEVHRFTARNVTEETFREMVRNAAAELEKKSGKLTLTRAKEIVSEVAAMFGFHYSVFSLSEDSVMVVFGLGDNRLESIINITSDDIFRFAVEMGAQNLKNTIKSSNKLTPEKMWQIVQEVCATDGERPWMIKNDDGSIREIHAYGRQWNAIVLADLLHIEKFREAVTNARDRRSAVRINLTVTGQSNSTATATVSWARFTY